MEPSPEEIRTELRRILASRLFANADRSRRFLSYVVEQTLAGNTDGIKELVLGIEVFDRTSGFDPRVDTIVRVEAGKLRKRLEEYYSSDGAGATLRIDIPKGAYVPQFQTVVAAEEAPPAAQRPKRRPLVSIAIVCGVVAATAVTAVMLRRPAEPPSIAVLPFLNLSPDPANEYFADGLTEDLTDALARLGSVRVASRTSAFAFKGKPADIRSIGRQLNVAYAVEGSVRKDGPRVKISAQLVRTVDGYHQWSNSFESDLNEVFPLQRRIAESIASSLAWKVSNAAHKRPTTNPEAFDHYIRGRYMVARGPLPDPAAAEALFRQAIAVDPAYPLPYLALAELYLQADILESRPPREIVPLAREAVAKALALDPDLAPGYVTQANILARHDYNWAAAEAQLRHALQLDPNLGAAYNARALHVLAPQGLWEEALAAHRKARELDPFSPEVQLAGPWLLCQARRFSGCLTESQDAQGPALAILRTNAHMGLGNWSSALDALRASPPSPRTEAMRGFCEASAGRPEEARKILARLKSRSGYVAKADLAILHTALGETTTALDLLEQARQAQESFLIFRSNPVFDPIRAQPRFQSLLTPSH